MRILLLTLFLVGCSSLPTKKAEDMIEMMRENGCEIAGTSVSKKKAEEKIVVKCK